MYDSAPILDGKYLGTVTADFVKVAENLKEASYLIRKQGLYAYPIFLMARIPLAIGAILVEKEAMDNQWCYYAAYLDLLVQHGLIANNSIDAFQRTYKDPDTYCCLLVVDNNLTNFIFVPYPEEL